MQRQQTRHVCRVLSTLLAAIMVLSLLATGTVLAQGYDADKAEHHKKPEGKSPAQQSWHDKKPGDGSALYLIGAEFGLTPEEVDKFLYLVKEMAQEKHSDMDGMEEDPWSGRMGPAAYGPRNRAAMLPAGGPARGHRYPGQPTMIEVVTIKRIYMDGGDHPVPGVMDKAGDDTSYGYGRMHPAMVKQGRAHGMKQEHMACGQPMGKGKHQGSRARMTRMDDGDHSALGAMDKAGDGKSYGYGRMHPAMTEQGRAHGMKQEHMAYDQRKGEHPENRAEMPRLRGRKGQEHVLMMPDQRVVEAGSMPSAMELTQHELLGKMALVLQDPAKVQSLISTVELFWPEASDMVEAMTGMPLADLAQDEDKLAYFMRVAQPMLADAMEQGLIPEAMVLQMLTILE